MCISNKPIVAGSCRHTKVLQAYGIVILILRDIWGYEVHTSECVVDV